MAESSSGRQGRRPTLPSPRRSDEIRSAGQSYGIIGLVRDLVDPDRYLLGTIAVLLTIGTPCVFCFAPSASYGYAMLAVTVCVISVIVARWLRHGSSGDGRGGTSRNG